MSVPGRKVSDFHGSAPDSHGSESHGSSSDFHDSLSHGSTSDSQGSVPHGSVSRGSDEDFNHDCEPCLTDGQHTQAHGYCVECKEYLCRNCFRYHQRTRALKHHQLLDKTNIDNLGITAKPSKTCTEKCEIHKEEIIKFFCPKHDVLGCTDCMTMNHRVCNIDYIPDKCNDIVNSAEYKDVVRQLDQKIVEADTAVKKANEKDNVIDTCHEKAKQDMDKFQTEIIQLISEKHKQIKAEIDARKSADKQKIKDLLTSYTQACFNINQLKSNIADSKANNQNGQMFIAIMRAKSHLKLDVNVLKENAESLEKTNVEYTFAHNNELKQMLSKYGKFGQLINSKDTGNVRMPYDSHSKDRDNSMPQDSHEGNCKMTSSKDTANSSWACSSTSRDTDISKKSFDSDSKDTANSCWARFSTTRDTDSSKKSYDSDSKDTDNSSWARFSTTRDTDNSKKSFDSDSKDTANSNWARFSTTRDTDSSKKSYDSDSEDTDNSSWARFSTTRDTDNSKKSYDSDSKNTVNSSWARFSTTRDTDNSKKSYDSDSKDTDNSNWAFFTDTDSSKILHDSNSKDTGNSNWACFTDSSKMLHNSNSKVTGNSKMSNDTSSMKTGKSKIPYDFKTKKTDKFDMSNDSQSKNTSRPKTSRFNDSIRKIATTVIPESVKPHTLSHRGYIDIKTETDLETCGTSACAILSFDRLLLADTDNMKLKIVKIKRLASTVTDEKILESPPRDIALLPKDEAAVTLPDKNKILLVATAGQLSIKNTIHVEGVCRGLTYNQDCLYVVCWNPYCVFVLEMDGKIKYAISLPSKCLSPHYIVYNPVFQLIYVSDMGRHSICSLTLQGDITAVFTDKGLRPLGMVMLDDGSLLVCNQFNNTIRCISGDLKQSWQVINGLRSWKPQSIIYSGDRNEVYIGASNSDQLKTFTLV